VKELKEELRPGHGKVDGRLFRRSQKIKEQTTEARKADRRENKKTRNGLVVGEKETRSKTLKVLSCVRPKNLKKGAGQKGKLSGKNVTGTAACAQRGEARFSKTCENEKA